MVFEYVSDSMGPCLVARGGDLPAKTQKADHVALGRRRPRSGWQNGPITFTSLRAAAGAPDNTRQQSGSDEKCIWKNVIAAATAGSVLTVSTFPLATIKTQMQAGVDSTFLGSIRDIVRRNGCKAFYAGLGPDLAQNLPYSALYIGTFEGLKSLGVPRPVAAAAGSAAACIVTVPADIVTQRMQVGLHGNAIQALGSILKAKGVGGLYAGLAPALVRIIPTAVVQWTVFENLKEHIEAKRAGKPLATHESLLLGGLAGSTAALFTCPVDVVKTRLQTGDAYLSVQQTVRRILAEEGSGALFQGLGPKTAMVFPSTAIFFCVYELLKKRLHETSLPRKASARQGRTPSRRVKKPSLLGQRSSMLREPEWPLTLTLPPFTLPDVFKNKTRSPAQLTLAHIHNQFRSKR
ncbi:Mitochondrial carrier protein [Klebsormidium nitens]|uniref:Mitochondrial carrier protein n=1 Tax=Klebsormidium nitens TaxID=105231 RepID=A0A1Y1HNN9_KLENI|nr:Mitochondrial carrier protein [Klebsormidium nitens]|eukprot:GAQ80260.1 Mitochondrial carrier protein [Klebsormidium nitens]